MILTISQLNSLICLRQKPVDKIIAGRLSRACTMLALIVVAILISCLYWDDPHSFDTLFAVIDFGSGSQNISIKKIKTSSVFHGNDRNIHSSP